MPPIEQNTPYETKDGNGDNQGQSNINVIELYEQKPKENFIPGSSTDRDYNDILNGFSLNEGAGDKSNETQERDGQGFIVKQTNAWGEQDVKYRDNGEVDTITFKGPDGSVHTYKRNAAGEMEEDSGTSKSTYRDIKVNQETGEIVFVKEDGSGFTHQTNGEVWGFNQYSQTTSHYDPSKNEYTTWEYDKPYSPRPSRTTTVDFDTNSIDNKDRQPRNDLFPYGNQNIPAPRTPDAPPSTVPPGTLDGARGPGFSIY